MKIITFTNNDTYSEVIRLLQDNDLTGYSTYSESAGKKKLRAVKKGLNFADFEKDYEANKQDYLDFIDVCRDGNVISKENVYLNDFTSAKDMIYKTLCYRKYKNCISDADISLAFELFSKSVNISLMHFLQVAERQLSVDEILLDFISIKLGGLGKSNFAKEKKGASDIVRTVKNLNLSLCDVEDAFFWSRAPKESGGVYAVSLVSLASALGNFLNAGLTKNEKTGRFIVPQVEKTQQRNRTEVDENILEEKLNKFFSGKLK
jgi:hypothetical protein